MVIFKKLANFDKKRRIFFLEKLEMNQKNKIFDHFLNVIKNTDKDEKEVFYKNIHGKLKKYFEEEAESREYLVDMDLDKSRIKIESLIKETEEEIYEALAYTENLKSKIKKHRKLMKANRWKDIKIITDNFKNIPEPPEQKDYDEDSKIIELPEPDKDIIKKENIYNCITERESRRKYSDESLSLKELSYLLYATQGVRERNDNYHKKTVPSGGARQPFETYIAVNNIEDLKRGIYRYLIFEHKLLYMKSPDNQKRLLKDAALGQEFVANSAAVFFWAALPYRVEWGYFLKSHKIILLEGGHVCQNLYLASESINCGTCAIGAYDQEKSDELLELDGEDEFVIYLAPVGKV